MYPHIRALLHDLPCLHDNDAVGKLLRERNIVCDEEKRGACTRREMLQIVRDHLPDGGVESLRWLVRENPLRFPCICHRAEHALQHAARQLMRIGAQDALRVIETKAFEERRIRCFIPCGTPCAAPHIRDLPSNAVHGAECRTRQLWDDAPAFSPIPGPQHILPERSYIHPIEQDPPRHLRLCGQCTKERLPER